MKAIEVKNLNYSYGDIQVLKNINFTIEKGSYVTIIGHNGSGKSTLAKLLMGLLDVEKDTITINNMELNEDNLYKIRKEIGIVFQNPDNQFIGSSVADDIAFGLENHQVDPAKMDQIIFDCAKKVGMENYLNHEPTKLSGGQKQRVAIAGVLAMNLKIIIFDEATSMLDPKGKKEINDLMKKLHDTNEYTIISITHDIEEIVNSDQVIVLDNGKLKYNGTPEEVLSHDEELIKMHLDIPFTHKIYKQLNKKGIKIKKNNSIEEVVEQLCQLNTKM